jgi:hypothetical protein
MSITQIADAGVAKDLWLEARQKFLTSSDFYTWIGDTPSWWSDTRHSILELKRTGQGKDFDHETAVSVAHGFVDEQHIMHKFARDVGARVEPVNSLTTNDRWPGLAASIDGYVHDIDTGMGKFELCQDREGALQKAQALEIILDPGDPVLCEIKKSTSAGWSNGKVSEWYVPQIQGQMYILDMHHCVIVADTILRKGRRTFWNLTFEIVERDPDFEAVMDRLNEEWLDAMGDAC